MMLYKIFQYGLGPGFENQRILIGSEATLEKFEHKTKGLAYKFGFPKSFSHLNLFMNKETLSLKNSFHVKYLWLRPKRPLGALELGSIPVLILVLNRNFFVRVIFLKAFSLVRVVATFPQNSYKPSQDLSEAIL